MKKLLILFLICAFHSNVSFGQSKYAIILGGGESERGGGTLFDKTIPLLGEYLNSNPKIMFDVAFGSGHIETQELINTYFIRAGIKRRFNSVNTEDILKKYIEMIERSEITSGDQIAIFILAHGAPRGKNEKTHGVFAFTNGIAEFNSLDTIEKLQKLANEHEIKLLISDSSCYSGSTQALSNEKTCVVSNTDASIFGHFDSNSFVFNFLKRVQQGKNAEELFLESRRVSLDNGFPRISTNYDQKLYEVYFKELRPFLLSVSKYIHFDNGGLLSYLNKISTTEAVEKNKKDFEKLLKALDEIQNGLRDDQYRPTIFGTKSLGDLRNNLFRIQNFFNEYLAFKLSVRKALDVVTIKYIATEGTKQVEKQTAVYYGDLVWGDFQSYLVHADKTNSTTLAEVERIRGVLKYRSELFYTDSQFSFQLKTYKKLESRARRLRENLDLIARDEKILYDYLQMKINKSTNKTSNPCREFIF